MGKRKKRKSNVGTIIMIIVIVLLSLFVYLLATKKIDFSNKNDDLVKDNTNMEIMMMIRILKLFLRKKQLLLVKRRCLL